MTSAMKKVTKERVLEVIAQSCQHIQRRTRIESKIIQQASLIGLQSLVGSDYNTEIDKLKLECLYAETGSSCNDLLALKAAFHRKITRHHARWDRIHEIQVKYGVSGLEQDVLELSGGAISVLSQNEQLALTEQDKEVLKEEKTRILDFWLQIVDDRELSIYRRYEAENHEVSWQVVDEAVVRTAASFYDTADAWENIRYDSYVVIHKQHWQINMVFRNLDDGIDDHSSRSEIYFSACSHQPTL